jgi:hypothetical protein
MKTLPTAQTANIVVQEMNGEILIYDLSTNKVFCLNETSAQIYRSCDGKTTFAELKEKFNFDEDFIFLALDELKRLNLLQQTQNYRSSLAGMSRREAVKKVGLGTLLALPVITSLVAPQAIQAQSICGLSCMDSSVCDFPCPACVGTGVCSNDITINCSIIGSAGFPCNAGGGVCIGTGNCQNIAL